MAMAKRIFLFLATNIAIMVVVSVLLPLLRAAGINVGPNQTGLLLFCLVWGMGASIVSLLMSRKAAKWSMGVKLVDGHTGNADLDWLYNTVGNLARSANLPMPEVGFYDSPEVNAFATGPSKNRVLVAVSTGLLRGHERSEVEAVLGHEVSHIKNGDMVTMVLIQGVINAFALYLAYVVAGIARAAVELARRRSALVPERDRGAGRVHRGPDRLHDPGLAHHGLVLAPARVPGGRGGRRALRARQHGGGASRLMTTQAAVDNRQPALATLKISGGKGPMDLFASPPPARDAHRGRWRGA